MAPQVTKAMMLRRPLFDAPLGSIHVKDLVKLHLRSENRLSDLWAGVIVHAVEAGIILGKEGDLFGTVFVKGVHLRTNRWSEGQPFLGPDGLPLILRTKLREVNHDRHDRVMNGVDGDHLPLGVSVLKHENMQDHPNYVNWLSKTLYAGGTINSSCTDQGLPLPYSSDANAVGPGAFALVGANAAALAPALAPRPAIHNVLNNNSAGAAPVVADNSNATLADFVDDGVRYNSESEYTGDTSSETDGSDSNESEDSDNIIPIDDDEEEEFTDAISEDDSDDSNNYDATENSDDAGEINDDGFSDTHTLAGEQDDEEDMLEAQEDTALPPGALRHRTWYLPGHLPSVSGRMRDVSSVDAFIRP